MLICVGRAIYQPDKVNVCTEPRFNNIIHTKRTQGCFSNWVSNVILLCSKLVSHMFQTRSVDTCHGQHLGQFLKVSSMQCNVLAYLNFGYAQFALPCFRRNLLISGDSNFGPAQKAVFNWQYGRFHIVVFLCHPQKAEIKVHYAGQLQCHTALQPLQDRIATYNGRPGWGWNLLAAISSKRNCRRAGKSACFQSKGCSSAKHGMIRGQIQDGYRYGSPKLQPFKQTTQTHQKLVSLLKVSASDALIVKS